MFEYDICFCGNKEECPLKMTCRRAQSHGIGIHTYSNFYNEEDEKCEYYIPVKIFGKENNF